MQEENIPHFYDHLGCIADSPCYDSKRREEAISGLRKTVLNHTPTDFTVARSYHSGVSIISPVGMHRRQPSLAFYSLLDLRHHAGLQVIDASIIVEVLRLETASFPDFPHLSETLRTIKSCVGHPPKVWSSLAEILT